MGQTGTGLNRFYACVNCGSDLLVMRDTLQCERCGHTIEVVHGIPRFVKSELHENFGIQWNRFSKVQLDSCNGSTESRDRLLSQSGLAPEYFKGKTVLEVGCGAGRFTEVLLSFGARVCSIDFSSAVDANRDSNEAAVERGDLLLAQGDIFNLPFKRQAFDVVFCYGVVQHTGDNRKAIHSLWQHVKPEGKLLVDCYQLSLRHVLPMKYLLRPFLKYLPPSVILRLAEHTANALVPIQMRIIKRLSQRKNVFTVAARLLLNRSPNSVYPVNLWVDCKIGKELVLQWSTLDTYDQWGPAFDQPLTQGMWRKMMQELARKQGGTVTKLSESGQGNVAVLTRNAC